MKTRIRMLCLVSASFLALSAHGTFKCVDDKGITHVGDTPPERCANVVMYEVSSSGMILRRIDPSLTADQVRAKTEEIERKKEAEKAQNEQKRKDLALLASYSTDVEIDTARDRNIEPLTGRIKSANDRMAAIDKRVAALEDEMEFYKAGKSKSKGKDGKEKASPEAPPMLVGELQRLKHEREVLAKGIAGSEREIVNVRTKYDADKKRWLALKSGRAPAMPGETPAADPKKP
jgi:hypothetical protein